MTIGVYDNTGTNLESSHGTYSISLALSPTGTFSGTYSGSASSGQITLASLRILSAGTFAIIASCTGVTSATSSSLSIVNYPHTMTLTPSTLSPSVNFLFILTVSLYGEDLNLYTGSVTIALSDSTSSINGDTSLAITTGIQTFNVYSTSIGSKTIIATCPLWGSYPAVTKSVSITALTLILKIISFSPIVRFI